MKQIFCGTAIIWSLPMWERGLKSGHPHRSYITSAVAPHVGAWIEIVCHPDDKWDEVAPHVGAWIEIYYDHSYGKIGTVAPHVGAWIEMRDYGVDDQIGLVAPHVGAWIEIAKLGSTACAGYVAPHVGAWIEISMGFLIKSRRFTSLPMWERGLKFPK